MNSVECMLIANAFEQAAKEQDEINHTHHDFTECIDGVAVRAPNPDGDAAKSQAGVLRIVASVYRQLETQLKSVENIPSMTHGFTTENPSPYTHGFSALGTESTGYTTIDPFKKEPGS